MRLLIITLLLIGCTAIAAEAKPISEIGLLNAEETSFATNNLKNRIESATKYYHSSLNSARSRAVNSSDAEEVARIDRALKGEAIKDFTSSYAQKALKSYEDKLQAALKTYLKSLDDDVKKLLKNGKNDDAIYVKEVISFLAPYAEEKDEDKPESSKSHKKSFKIEADKDWQDCDVTIQKGSEVEIKVSGKWAPGVLRKKNKPNLADADTYRLQIAGLTGNPFACGKEYTFVTNREGKMMARMLPVNRMALSEARGRVTVYIKWKDPVEQKAKEISKTFSDPIETVLKGLIKNELASGKKDSEKGIVHRVIIDADELEWEDTGVTVKEGEKVTIKASGEWTPHKEKRPKANADKYRYIARVGNAWQGTGGVDCSFVSNAAGKLMFRTVFHQRIKEKNWHPEGKLRLEFYIGQKEPSKKSDSKTEKTKETKESNSTPKKDKKKKKKNDWN